jgi:hypothetical protein
MYVQGFSVEMRPSLSSVIRFPAKRRALSRHFIPNMYLKEMEEMESNRKVIMKVTMTVI